jgi:hypothetical protein
MDEAASDPDRASLTAVPAPVLAALTEAGRAALGDVTLVRATVSGRHHFLSDGRAGVVRLRTEFELLHGWIAARP